MGHVFWPFEPSKAAQSVTTHNIAHFRSIFYVISFRFCQLQLAKSLMKASSFQILIDWLIVRTLNGVLLLIATFPWLTWFYCGSRFRFFFLWMPQIYDASAVSVWLFIYFLSTGWFFSWHIRTNLCRRFQWCDFYLWFALFLLSESARSANFFLQRT